MRISDWSSDVCSSDLLLDRRCARSQILQCAREHGRRSRARNPDRHRGLAGRGRRTRRAGTAAALSTRHLRGARRGLRSEEHTSELQSLMRISYAVFCLKKKKKHLAATIETTV